MRVSTKLNEGISADLTRFERMLVTIRGSSSKVAVLLWLISPVLGSIGDLSPPYQRCLAQCIAQCPPTSSANRFALWPCPAECQYDCTQRLTDLALASDFRTGGYLQQPGQPLEHLAVGSMVQFHGKWPFHRLGFGPFKMQEPLSVLFSILNLVAHYHGLRQLSRRRQKDGLVRAYKLYALTGINTWIWSAVFHTRDVDWTEKADYFSAAGGMLAGLWMAGVRLGGLYAGRASQTLAARIWAFTCAGIFASHCIYLASGPRFDYTYNMQFNVVIGLAQIALWACWSAYHCFFLPRAGSADSLRTNVRSTGAPHAHLPLVPLLLLPALSALELLDFAPIGPFGLRLLDAHALWHASTAPVVIIWYRFLIKDLDWTEAKQERSRSRGRDQGRIAEEEGAKVDDRRLD